jgi:signal transduction histidine kinase/CheY-like chemotaxis protein
MVLQRVMSRLGEVLTLAELSAVVAEEVQRTFGASRVALLVEDDGGWRDLVTGELTALVPPDGARSLWLGSAQAIVRVEPRLSALSPYAVTVLPLVVRGRRLGVLALGFPAEHATGAWEEAVASDIALQVAHALDRTLLYDAAERASRAKDEFFAMLGHELRNPLSPILTATQLMRLRDEAHCAKERTIIERQAQGLVRLVDDLLDVARITRGKLGIECRLVDLAVVIAAAVEQMAPVVEADAHRIAVDVPPGTMLELDAARMVQVFSNLIGNAAKYSPRGAPIEISAVPAGDSVAIAVRDHGAGIEPALLPRIFDVFVQGPQRSDRPRGGLGLGLAIARTIVGMHGGALRAASDGPGLGSVFTVELPYPRGEAGVPGSEGDRGAVGEGAAATDERLGEQRPKRLLLVDDNEDGVGLLALWLAKRGHDVRVAYDPRSALAIAREFRPDVAILDIGLPGMDGYQLAAALREQRPEASIRMIALTGYGQPSDRSRSAEAGFAVHLVKPVDLGVFQAAIAGRVEPPVS